MVELRVGNIIAIGLAALLFFLFAKFVARKMGREDLAQLF